ncbi:flagellar biosynthesis regulator FlaF [Humitalea rosea]|uniref:Flagellar biosynthesis regulator FlaF n=1 Tax=Humitalea rosea TaxID=990373 RepID=A0A2W7IGV9_9PROT|nr:flagellar biosynthesis regulator FlaF [Humitalea rosea]PZW44872.1 flagellar biosynthesis regulator FlaF [Humitalea rosea]
MSNTRATLAYRRTSETTSLREQEADVFRRVIGALRGAEGGDIIRVARALADTRRLWMSVESALRDPGNSLPAELRASLVSVARTIQRELDAIPPDIPFLIEMNEHVAAGLSGQ